MTAPRHGESGQNQNHTDRRLVEKCESADDGGCVGPMVDITIDAIAMSVVVVFEEPHSWSRSQSTPPKPTVTTALGADRTFCTHAALSFRVPASGIDLEGGEHPASPAGADADLEAAPAQLVQRTPGAWPDGPGCAAE
jgi:hypothetical protein